MKKRERMATNVKLLRHQGLILQSPYIHPETKFHFDVAGYGAGKTSGLVYSLVYTVDKLQDKKDAEGNYARVMLASKNLTFLSKTSISNLEQILRRTGTDYRYDKKNNIITVGTVDIFLIPLENPEVIYGYSCFEENTMIMTEWGEVKIKDIKEGMKVWTTKGWKKVKHVFNNGERGCIRVTVGGRSILCTPDHRFIDSFDNEIKAQDLTKTTSLVKIDTKKWQKWLNTSGKIDENLKLLISMVSGTTDTLILNHMEKGVISPVQMKIRKRVIQLCTEICGLLSTVQFRKDMMCTTKMETVLITLLKTLNLLQGESMLKSIGNFSLKKNGSKLLKQLDKLKRSLLSYGKMSNTESKEKLSLKNLLKAEVLSVSVNAVEKSLKHMLSELLTALSSVREMSLTVLPEQLTGQDTESKEYALSVEKSLKQTGIQRLQLAHLTAKTSSVVGQYTVYDLEVEDVHEYFANGVRVHNCVASFLDELSELPPDVCMEAIKAVNERTRQTVKEFRDPFIISVSSSQGLDGQYMAMEHFRKNGISYVYIRGETRDNTYLKKSDIDNLYKIYNDVERKVYLEGYFMSVKTRLVFSDYDPVKNKLAVDLYNCLEPDDTVYIGQDFNCIEGEVLIDTIKGKVRMKNLKEGDYVLTRKGYKKVLHKVCKGNKIVQEFNNGLVATPDHVAITPEGEVELCKAQKFYYLSKQSTESLKEKRKALMRLLKLKKLYLTEESTTEIQKVQLYAHTISGMEKEVCIEIFMNIILEKLQKEIISTTKTDIMITDLKHLSLLLNRNMLKYTAKKKVVYEVRKVLQNLQNIILLGKEEKSTEEFQKLLGKMEHTIVLLFALIVVKNLMLELKLQSDVQNVNINGIFSERERLIKAWKDTVLYVENLLQEQVQLHIAQNTEVIGKDLNIKERGIQKVYDIEVEDCHEFYANGILVHNCFGNAAVACVVKKGAIIVLKDYDIPDIRRAPEIFRYDFPTQKIVWIPDATATSFYTQFKKELWSKNIKISYRKSNPLVQDRVFVINKLMYAERMFICPLAKSVEHSLLTHQFDPKTQQPMKGGKGAPDHISDAMGYAVYHIMCWVKDMKDIYDVTLGRTQISRLGSLGQEIDAGSNLLSSKIKFEVPDNVDNLA